MSVLKNFSIVDLVKTRSDSVISITGYCIKFNLATVVELHYSPYIQILVNPKDKQFAIRACKQEDPNAISFSKPDQKFPIKFAQKTVVDMIRKMAGWSAEENWNIPGVYFADDDALVYDIAAAVKPAERKGGWIAKRQKEAEAANN